MTELPYRILDQPKAPKLPWASWRVVAETYDFSFDGRLRATPGQVLGARMFRWTAWLLARLYVATHEWAMVRVKRHIEENS